MFAATSLRFKIQEKCFHIRKIHIFALRPVHIIDGVRAPTGPSVAWNQQNNSSGYSLSENMDNEQGSNDVFSGAGLVLLEVWVASHGEERDFGLVVVLVRPKGYI